MQGGGAAGWRIFFSVRDFPPNLVLTAFTPHLGLCVGRFGPIKLRHVLQNAYMLFGSILVQFWFSFGSILAGSAGTRTVNVSPAGREMQALLSSGANSARSLLPQENNPQLPQGHPQDLRQDLLSAGAGRNDMSCDPVRFHICKKR